MGIGTFLFVLALAWVVQIVLAWRQARQFMASVRALRAHGKVAIGASGNRMRGRAYVAMAVGPDGTVTAAETLRGMTVFARPRPVPALVGRRAADLAAALSAGGADADLPELPRRVREAALSSAVMLHPPAGGTTPPPPAPPWYRRLLHPRGGAAQA